MINTITEAVCRRLQRGYRRLLRMVLPAGGLLSPSERLAAKALGSVLIVLLLVLGLWFAIVLPFVVARKLISAFLCLAVSAALLFSARELRKGRVKRAIWIFNTALWSWAGVTALLSGGIRSVALLGFLPGFVTTATLLGQHIATLSCAIFLGFALVLALLDMAGIHLPNYFPFPPLTIWVSALLTAVVVALPLNQLLRFLRSSIDRMDRQLHGLETAARVLRESEAKSRVILESARDGIILADAETGRLLGINPAAERLSGGRIQILQELLAAHTDRDIRETAPAAESAGGALTDALLTREDGVSISVELAANVVVGESGKRLLVGIFRDTSERKSAELERLNLETRLQQAERLETVGRLAGGVAHDFNNLLTVINGFSNLVLSRLAPDDENRFALEQIRNAGERAANLTQQLLAFSRKQEIQPRTLDLNAFLREVQPMLRSLLTEDIELTLGLAVPLVPVVADPGQMHQVLMNLAANARDAMPRGGTLTIETKAITLNGSHSGAMPGMSAGAYVLLAVSDTGIGMDQDVRAHAFEPFFTTKGVGQGTGLGLSTVYGIIQQNHGAILIDSEPGKGTTFRIYLPAAAGEALTAEVESWAARALPGVETILVVEDQDNVRKLTAEILAAQGFRVLQAANGFDALSLARTHAGPIHLVLTDVVMPGMTGPELVERVRSIRPGTRVLFMSGYSEEVVQRRGASGDSAVHVPKPFTPAALIGKVREALEGSGKF